MSFEFGVTQIAVQTVPVEAFGGDIPITVELVPIEAFAGSDFEFGVTPVAVFGTFLDLLSGGIGGQFEFGATDIALTGVPIEYGQSFSPFELGVTPITVTRVDAGFYAIPPATLAASTTGLDLSPSTREFEPPRYAVTFEQSMAGMSEAVLWGNKPGGAKMALGYGAVEDEWAEAWMKLYDDSREVSPLELPSEVYSGLSVGLTNIYNLTKYGLKWFFVGPPKIESVKEGFSAVDIDLEGRNAKTLPYSASGYFSPDAPPPVAILPPGDPYVPLPDGDVTDEDEEPGLWSLGWMFEDYIDNDDGFIARRFTVASGDGTAYLASPLYSYANASFYPDTQTSHIVIPVDGVSMIYAPYIEIRHRNDQTVDKTTIWVTRSTTGGGPTNFNSYYGITRKGFYVTRTACQEIDLTNALATAVEAWTDRYTGWAEMNTFFDPPLPYQNMECFGNPTIYASGSPITCGPLYAAGSAWNSLSTFLSDEFYGLFAAPTADPWTLSVDGTDYSIALGDTAASAAAMFSDDDPPWYFEKDNFRPLIAVSGGQDFRAQLTAEFGQTVPAP